MSEEKNVVQYNKVEQKSREEILNKKEESLAEEPRLKQVVVGKKRKKNLVERLIVGFMDTDGEGTSVGKRVMGEIIIPSIKDTLASALKNGVDIWMYGGSGGGRQDNNRSGYMNGRSHTPYHQQYRQPTQRRNQPIQASHAIIDFEFNTRQDAVTVLNTLIQQIDTYSFATVADYYDLIGEASAHTHVRYGWTDLSRVQIMNHRGAYIINLPAPEAI